MDTALASLGDSLAPVNWNDNGLQIGSVQSVSYPMVGDYWWPNTYPVNAYNYITTWHQPRPNATEMAFKIVAKLLEDGMVEELTVKQFVKLVDDVAKIVKDS